MARSIPAPLLARLEQSPLKLCRLFELTLIGGATFRFTDHDNPVVFDGDVYENSDAITIQAVESSSGNVAVNTEVIINYVDGLTREGAVSGAYDNADFFVWICSYDAPDDGRFNVLSGSLQQKMADDKQRGSFTVKGLARTIDGYLGEIYTADCRANLGDTRCKVDLTPFTFNFEVTDVDESHSMFEIDVTGVFASGYFTLGNVKFNGDEYAIEIGGHSSLGGGLHNIFLALPRYTEIEVGDEGVIIAGCDKRLRTCWEKFDNIVNMRAEPFVPGDDITTQPAP